MLCVHILTSRAVRRPDSPSDSATPYLRGVYYSPTFGVQEEHREPLNIAVSAEQLTVQLLWHHVGVLWGTGSTAPHEGVFMYSFITIHYGVQYSVRIYL